SAHEKWEQKQKWLVSPQNGHTDCVIMADFGEILRNIGEFGLFQRVTLAALCFINFSHGFLIASILFIEKNPDRHCNTDWILGLDPNLTTDEQLNLTLPREADGTFSRCQMFVPVDWDIDAIREFGLNKTTSCQNGWVYKSTLYTFDLVCDTANLLEIIQAISMVGVLVVSYINSDIKKKMNTKTDWRLAKIIIAAPLGVVLLYIWFIPESARWLLSRGRTEEAKQLIMKAAAISKRTIPDSLLENVLTLGLDYFHLSFIHLYFFIFGAIEIPAHILCIWLLEVFGRKPLFMLTLATAGLSSILILAVPQGCGIAVTSLAAVSPTGLSSISGRSGAIVAPLLNITAMYHWIIPILVSSSLTFISGGLGFMLPETRRRELPDSIDEAEGKR
uniref:Solute carrier family 22 member 13a n=1 Tax=Sphaeramia orbicularis TaxID=375764 RepID=A0A673B498_9TELE